MKKLICLLMALCLMAAPCAFAQEHGHMDEDGAQLANPMHDVQTLDELRLAVPGALLADLPQGIDTVTYSYIHTEPLIAQVQFNWGENMYTMRAAVLNEEGESTNIDGVFLTFDEYEDFDNLFDGEEDLLQVYSSFEDEYALCNWVIHSANTQYSLFSETGGEPDMPIIEMAAMLMESQTTWSVDGDE